MSHQPPTFYGRASTARAVKQTTAVRRYTGASGGQRHPLRLLNSNLEQGYQPGMYLPEQTLDENAVDSPLSEDLGHSPLQHNQVNLYLLETTVTERMFSPHQLNVIRVP